MKYSKKNEFLQKKLKLRKRLTNIFWNIEVWAVQKHANLVDLVKSFPTSIYLQNLASIQPRTSLSTFVYLLFNFQVMRFTFHTGTFASSGSCSGSSARPATPGTTASSPASAVGRLEEQERRRSWTRRWTRRESDANSKNKKINIPAKKIKCVKIEFIKFSQNFKILKSDFSANFRKSKQYWIFWD